MVTVRIIREILNILFGIGAVAAVVILRIEWYYGLLGLGLIVWGIYDIRRELRDSGGDGEVAEAARERDAIRNRLEGDG